MIIFVLHMIMFVISHGKTKHESHCTVRIMLEIPMSFLTSVIKSFLLWHIDPLRFFFHSNSNKNVFHLCVTLSQNIFITDVTFV